MTYKDKLIELLVKSAACPSLLKLPEKCSGLRCQDCRKKALNNYLKDKKNQKDLLLKLIEYSMCCPTLLHLKNPNECPWSCQACRKQAVNRYLKGEERPEWKKQLKIK